LTFHNCLRNTQDRVETLLDVLDEPPRLLELLLQPAAPASPFAPRKICAYMSLMRRRGITSGLSCAIQPLPLLRTNTSGTTKSASGRL
jgi:hypothetical protein